MGSMIQLSVGNLQVDWGKNRGFTDHSAFFQTSDVTLVPYYYVVEGSDYIDEVGETQWKITVEYKEGLSKPLCEVKDRIALLGHTIEHCRQEFMYLANLNNFDSERFEFESLKVALATVDVSSIALPISEGDEDFGEFFREQVFPKLGMKLPDGDTRHVLFSAAEGMENLSSHSVLRLLAENPTAATLPVIWAYKDLEDGGWASRDEFVHRLEPSERFLIVTEGSSDAAILKHALKILKPHIADFFDFIDMEEGYPFSGTGNLYKFIQGLISISIQNNVIVLFDNDAEGIFSFNRCSQLNVPANMRVLKLPDLAEFRFFPTVGPGGQHRLDINGQAAALECYLQLDDNACIRWSSFNSNLSTYQGALINKDRYKDCFLGQRSRVADYDYKKIEAVLDMIFDACVSLKEFSRTEELGRMP
ncbi:HEPN/Toprim-associated domain-containing protein [Bradyrhizobium sp.]|uniref:HEPN/Toprim-associated domain-containing protein n=1 Tax=Bradyrhizobium sp. TaxID=376 RepID=UPI002733DFF6|nr:HEPN/Toprim-associated domain-containing protein [Bradyrhizobium sp.]MDP3692709.1 HEPN/Toprim-associated domain-containing protein [Bradyrhizobium sp.]